MTQHDILEILQAQDRWMTSAEILAQIPDANRVHCILRGLAKLRRWRLVERKTENHPIASGGCIHYYRAITHAQRSVSVEKTTLMSRREIVHTHDVQKLYSVYKHKVSGPMKA